MIKLKTTPESTPGEKFAEFRKRINELIIASEDLKEDVEKLKKEVLKLKLTKKHI